MDKFRDVPGFEGAYQVNRSGVVRSVSRTVIRKDGKPLRVTGRVLSTTVNDRGYERLTLVRPGRTYWRCGVHQVVARAWLPKPPRKIASTKDGFVVNHKDGNKLNNHAANLEYVASTANIYHARATGALSAKGVRNNKARLTDDQVRQIREAYSTGERQSDLAHRFGVDQTSISRIVRRDSWAHIA